MLYEVITYLYSLLHNDYDVYIPNKSEMDVTLPESVDEYYSKIGGQVDYLINNAGVLHSSRIADSDVNKWINDINVNLIGTYLVSRVAVRLNPKVKIINISSTAAFNAYKDWRNNFV